MRQLPGSESRQVHGVAVSQAEILRHCAVRHRLATRRTAAFFSIKKTSNQSLPEEQILMGTFRQTGECQGKSCRQAASIDGAVQVRYDNVYVPKNHSVAAAKVGDRECSGVGGVPSQIPCDYVVAARLTSSQRPLSCPGRVLDKLQAPYKVVDAWNLDIFAKDYKQLGIAQKYLNEKLSLYVGYSWSPRKVVRSYRQLFEPVFDVEIRLNAYARTDDQTVTDVYCALPKVGVTTVCSNKNRITTSIRVSDVPKLDDVISLAKGSAAYTLTPSKWIPCGHVYEYMTVENK